MDYSAQLARKSAWAESKLGQWKAHLRELRSAPESERLEYRSKCWLRSSYKDGTLSFGMLKSVQGPEGWEKEFTSWNTCPIHTRAIQRMIETLREVLPRDVGDFVENSLVGVWLGSPHLVVVARQDSFDVLKELDWSQVLEPPFDRAWFHHNHQVGTKVFGYREILPLAGPPVEGAHPVKAFRQVAGTLLLEARAQAARELLKGEPRMVVDLYCGTGELSGLLPSGTGWLGVELSKEAVAHAATLRRARSGLHEAFVGTVEHRLKDPRVAELIEGPYALYLNPPRSGLSWEARDTLIGILRDKPAQRIVYLSCSASSLGRDLRDLEAEGYRVDLLQTYDFFPQTEHFETVAVLGSG